MRWSELQSLLVRPFLIGLLGGALLAAKLGPAAALPGLGAAPVAGQDQPAAEAPLEQGPQDPRDEPLMGLLKGAQARYGGHERRELIRRIAAKDPQALEWVEAAAKQAPNRYLRGVYLSLLLSGTQEPRWLDALLEAVDGPSRGEKPRTMYWNVFQHLLERGDLDAELRIRMLAFLATRAPDEAGEAFPILVGCSPCYEVEKRESPAIYYRLVQRLRDHVLGGSPRGELSLYTLEQFSVEGYLATVATVLANEKIGLMRRAYVFENYRDTRKDLERESSPLAVNLPEGGEAAEWQRWTRAHRAMVSGWLEPDLVASRSR